MSCIEQVEQMDSYVVYTLIQKSDPYVVCLVFQRKQSLESMSIGG